MPTLPGGSSRRASTSLVLARRPGLALSRRVTHSTREAWELVPSSLCLSAGLACWLVPCPIH